MTENGNKTEVNLVKTAIGAWSNIKWLDDNREAHCYISFGGQVEDEDGDIIGDRYGIPDEKITFFADDEAELMKMKSEEYVTDFIVLDYQLEYLVPAFISKEKGMSTDEAFAYTLTHGEYDFQDILSATSYAVRLSAGEGGVWVAEKMPWGKFRAVKKS